MIASSNAISTPPSGAVDDVFDLLSSPRRRGVIKYLSQSDGAVELSKMANTIAAWEQGKSVDNLTPAERKRVYTSLQQTHLEKLEDAGVVEYEQDEKLVRGTPKADELLIYLEIVPGRELSWREYYVTLGAVGLALTLAVYGDFSIFAMVPDALVGGILAAVLLVSAVVQYRYHRQTGRSFEDRLET